MTEGILFFMLITGVLILKLPELKDVISLCRMKYVEWKNGFFNEEMLNPGRQNVFRHPVLEHIRRCLQIAFSMGTGKSVKTFLLISGIMGMGAMLLAAGKLSVTASAATGLMAGILPYLGLRCIIQGRQVAGSHEGEVLVTELLNNYKIHYCNMPAAVEATAMTLEGAPYSRRLLFNLSRGLNKAAGPRQIRLLTEEFRFAVGTSWGNILADNIYLACIDGIRVSDSLSDLAKSMKAARQTEEFSRRESNEARMILKYLLPLGSCVMTAGGIHFFGLTAAEWFDYQFRSPAGLAWFILWVTTYMTAVGVHLLLTNRKFDL